MGRFTLKTVDTDTWVLLTDADASAITFQNVSATPVLIKATAGATPPSDDNDARGYGPGKSESNARLSELFPDVDDPTRVYAKGQGAKVLVSSN